MMHCGNSRQLVPLALLLIGCTEPYTPLPESIPLREHVLPTNAAETYEVTDSAGVQRMANGAIGAWGAAILPVLKVQSIGVVQGDQSMVLDDIRDVAVGPTGHVFAASGKAAFVQAFDSAGRFLRQLGRQGEGPGEMRTPDRIWLAGDTLVVLDWTLKRTTAFRVSDGEVLHTWSRMGQSVWVRPVARGLAGWIAEVQAPGWFRPTGPVLADSLLLHRFELATGSSKERLLAIDLPQQRRIHERAEEAQLPLFAVAPSHGFDRDGRIYVSSDRVYRVDVYGSDGRLERQITRAYEPVPVDDSSVRRLKEFVETVFERDSILRGSVFIQSRRIDGRRQMGYAATLPPIGRILVSDVGWIWVERADAPPPGYRDVDTDHRRPLPLGSRWDLFEPPGRFMGTVDLPPRFRAMAVRGNEITGVWRDDDLVEYAVTFRALGP